MSFLTQNLDALPRDIRNENSRVKSTLEAYQAKQEKMPSDERIFVYETRASDLTILYEDRIPLHSMEGAQAEAKRLVEDQAVYNKYAINVILGMGVGYVAQAMVAAIRAKNSRARIVIFEPQLDVLHFTLTNVNLTKTLSYEHMHLFTDAEQLWHYVETNMVPGDGVSFCITDGTLQAFSTTLGPVIERLTTHAENAVRNVNVLKIRSKLWTQEFLANLPDLPSCYNADQLNNVFEGKTALLCGAGPSLNDILPHVHAIRDKVVICAVSGAVKALDRHGLVADFVFGMDYVGPSRQMAGMEDPIKHSHIITGPSAEHFMFDTPAKSRWLATLKYNDQYASITDEMFGGITRQYNTGGTVAFYMLLVAIHMGLKDVILAGQDLALRGNQVYATGETTEIRGKLLVSQELHNRCVTMCHVKGWNGEELMTQDDYKHFKSHYDTIRDKIRAVHPAFNIYNVSVGGALIDNMENLPIEELIAKVGLAKQDDFKVDDVINAAIGREKALPDFTERPQRLYEKTVALIKHSEETMVAAEDAQEKLRQLSMLKSCSWEKASSRYSDSFNTFSELLEGNTFLRDTLYHEQLTIYQSYNDFAETEQNHRDNFKVDGQYLKLMIHMLGDRMLPVLKRSQARLKETHVCEDIDEMAVTFDVEF